MLSSVTVAKLALLSALAGKALAHGTVPGFTIDGVYQTGWLLDYWYKKHYGVTPPITPGWYAEDLDTGYIDGTEYQNPNVICHKNAFPANATATVAAGDTVSFHWTPWPESHVGPILTYVARCDGSCSLVDKTELQWVKIDEVAIDLTTQKWPTDAMIANNNTYTVTVPSSLAAGNYVFRHEIIALHSAPNANGAQNYPQCINIAITGDGTDKPTGVVGTDLYRATDPGILFNPYRTVTAYTIPGPPLYTGGKSAVGSSPSPSPSSSASASASSPTPVATTSATTTPTTASTTSTTPTTLATSTRAAHTHHCSRRRKHKPAARV